MEHYEQLGVNRLASFADIKTAYRELAKKYHPDKHSGGDGRFLKIQKAYEILSDPVKRQEYEEGTAARYLPDPRGYAEECWKKIFSEEK